MEKAKLITSQDLDSLQSRLLGTLDEGIFFGELSQYFLKNFPADNILVFKTFDDHSAELVAKSGKKIENGIKLGPGDGLAGYVNRTRRAYYSNSVARDPLFASFKYKDEVSSELCVPVTSQGAVLATIHFQMNSTDYQYSQDDVTKIMEILTAIERPILNMKMYLSAKHLNEALLRKIQEKEKELAQRHAPAGEHHSSFRIREVNILGKSAPIVNLIKTAEKIGASSAHAVILGESGTGKELISRKIHLLSDRREGAFIVLNCGALQESLLESELFGHAKGAFAGAISEKLGLIERSHGGTLFLDEIHELSPMMQTKLLHFLQKGEAYRIGENKSYRSDVRILAASNKSLKNEVGEGHFREDLYFRLNTFEITVPPLRERGEDISLLAAHFLNQGRKAEEEKILTPGAIKILSEYKWPGNIRELQNIMERAFIMCDGKFVEDEHLPQELKQKQKEEPKVGIYREMTLDDVEREHILLTLDHMAGNKTKSAKALGITVKTLYNKLHSYGMIPGRDNA